jgi:hypothetical protein
MQHSHYQTLLKISEIVGSKKNILGEIYNGWKNLVVKNDNPEVEEIAKERIGICVECPEFKSSKTCGICGCFMPAKVRSMKSSCPDGKWGARPDIKQ